jgi:hypothetical protein
MIRLEPFGKLGLVQLQLPPCKLMTYGKHKGDNAVKKRGQFGCTILPLTFDFGNSVDRSVLVGRIKIRTLATESLYIEQEFFGPQIDTADHR